MPSKPTNGAPRRYASDTKVPVERSCAELEALLSAHGAREFGLYKSDARHIVQYRVHDRVVRHVVDVPAPASFQRKRSERQLTGPQLEKLAAAEWRRRWRALLLLTKAKLELVASGQTTMDREFMGDVMLPDGRLVHEALAPILRRAYLDGHMPDALLLGPGGPPTTNGQGENHDDTRAVDR